MSTITERVTFPGSTGARLVGRLERAAGEPAAWALFAHCFTCSKDLKAAVRISRSLAARGIAVLRFDFTGLGESEGDFAGTDFSSNLDDLVAAADFLRHSGSGPELLIGHSLGGAAVLAVARLLPEVRAVATLGAPASTAHLRADLLARAPELATASVAEVELAGRRIRVGRRLLDDLDEPRLETAIGRLGVPLLIVHSPVDEVVPIEHAARIYTAARHPKSFLSLDGADHLLLAREEDSRFVAEVLAAWASRYLVAAPGASASGPPHGEVVVEGAPSGLAQRIQAGAHELRADEPESAGGTASGPDPYGLLLAALGACKSMTLRIYADRKRWPLAGTRIRLRHGRVHAEDCAHCETEQGLVDRIDVEVGLDGPLDGEQRQRLLEISERCPVHRTLVSEIRIESELASAGSPDSRKPPVAGGESEPPPAS